MNYNNEINEILSVEQASKLLMTGRNAIYKLLESGELKGLRLSDKGTWRIPKASITEFIRKRTQL